MIIRAVRESDFAAVGEVDTAARLHAYTGVLPAEELAAVTPEAQSAV